MKKYCVYLRVSTTKQGASGLGIEAQRKMCLDFIERNGGESSAEFVDVESGTHRDRKGLWQAIDFCKRNNTPLVIAKLDRLARDVEFTFRVINSGIEIHFCDMPVVNTMILGVFAAVAQYERELCSSRTKAALEQKKAAGAKLGASSDKYQETRAKRSIEEIEEMAKKRGETKRTRHLENRDIQAFLKILKSVFPDATVGEPQNWQWREIKTSDGIRQRVLMMMRDYREIDSSLFAKWDFEDINGRPLQVKLASYISNLKKSIKI
ncbi:MAG: recombinase family protein [Methanobrevibacter sp.]|nr:recombinase family protein [Methanobrevibacter sp.]